MMNEKVNNPELVEIIENIQMANTDENQILFYKEIYHAKFLLPAIIKEENKIKLVNILDNKGMKYLPAYTDWENMQFDTLNSNYQAIIFSTQDYCKLLQSDKSILGIVINPFTHNLVIKRENEIWNNDGKYEIAKGDKVAIGLAKDYPQEMIEILKEYFNNNLVVYKAYLLWMARDNEVSYLLIMDTDEGPNSLFPKVAEICQPYLNGEILDIIPLNSSFAKNAVENQTPFFVRV